MTIVVVWERKSGEKQELCVASDSRLSGAGRMDCAQKIFILPRQDCFMAFCGDTAVSFPIIFQVHNFINNYHRALDRSLDITDLRFRIVELINSIRFDQTFDSAADQFDDDNTKTHFIFGGFSWKVKSFKIWTIRYDKKIGRFNHRTAEAQRGAYPGNKLAVIGDYRDIFHKKLRALLGKSNSLNWEPLKALIQMLQDPEIIDYKNHVDGRRMGLIGGPPQFLKAYPHLKCLPFAFYWGQTGEAALFGRKLLDYERTQFPIISPDTFNVYMPLDNIKN